MHNLTESNPHPPIFYHMRLCTATNGTYPRYISVHDRYDSVFVFDGFNLSLLVFKLGPFTLKEDHVCCFIQHIANKEKATIYDIHNMYHIFVFCIHDTCSVLQPSTLILRRVVQSHKACHSYPSCDQKFLQEIGFTHFANFNELLIEINQTTINHTLRQVFRQVF